MTLLILLTIYNTTISSNTIHSSNTITFYDYSQKNKIIINANETVFIFSCIIIDTSIAEKLSLEKTTLNGCVPVEKVTIIRFGNYVTHPDTEVNPRFYTKTFTHISFLYFDSSKNLEVSDEYQHFSLFVKSPSLSVFDYM